ncbi:MAG: Fic family protein [bacterium]
MKSLEAAYLENLTVPNRLLSTVRRIGEHKGRQDLHKQRAPEMLENLRQVGIIQTAEAMRALHREYKEQLAEETWEPLLLISFYVLDFLCIHPFLDGNGRMARLLTVLALYHEGYEVGRYISLERIVEQTKESYYDTLYASSQGWHDGRHDIWPWTEYSLSVLLAAYEEFESRIEKALSGPGSKTEMVLSAIAGFLGDFGISDVEKACPTVSRDMIRHVLFKERDAGRIEAIGKGRGAKWRKLV